MINKNAITILSTFTDDKLVSRDGLLLCEQKGGPAFYLSQVFQKEEADFCLKTGSKMEVKILVNKDGEFGQVPKISKSKIIRFAQIKTPFLLISSVLREFNLTELPDYQGRVFFDVQGYVRDGNYFGKKKLWKPNKNIFSSIFCLKGTREELRSIPAQYIKIQKQKILIITDGKKGGEIFARGKRYFFRPSQIIITGNTIGAGDTFMANFVWRFIKTGKFFDSAQYAGEKTSAFLSSQKSHKYKQLFREEIACV